MPLVSCGELDDELKALREAGLAKSVISKINNILSDDVSVSNVEITLNYPPTSSQQIRQNQQETAPQEALPTPPKSTVGNSVPTTSKIKETTKYSPYDFNCFYSLNSEQLSKIRSDQDEMDTQLKHLGESLKNSPKQINKQELMEMHNILSEYFSNSANSMWSMIRGSMESGKECCEHLKATYSQLGRSSDMNPAAHDLMSQAVKRNEKMSTKQFVELVQVTQQFKVMIETYIRDMSEMAQKLNSLHDVDAKDKQQKKKSKKSSDIAKEINKILKKFQKEEVKKIKKFLEKVKTTTENQCPNPNVKKTMKQSVKDLKKDLKKTLSKKKK